MSPSRRLSFKGVVNICILTLIPPCAVISCSNSGKRAEEDRRNIHLAQFFYGQDILSKTVEHAKKIKHDSPHYSTAQELILQAGE